MERTLGFGLGELRGELARLTRPTNCAIPILVLSSTARRQAHGVATRGSPYPTKSTTPKRRALYISDHIISG